MQRRTAKVNTSDQSIFPKTAKPAAKLCKYFSISLLNIEAFLSNVSCTNIAAFLDDIFHRMNALKKNNAIDPQLKEFLFHKDNQPLILAICSDIPDLIHDKILNSREIGEKEKWVKASFVAGCVEFPLRLLNFQKTYQQAFHSFMLAFQTGRKDLMRFILDPEQKFNLKKLHHSDDPVIFRGDYILSAAKVFLAFKEIHNALAMFFKKKKFFEKKDDKNIIKRFELAKAYDVKMTFVLLNHIINNPEVYGLTEKNLKLIASMPWLIDTHETQTLVRLIDLHEVGIIKLPNTELLSKKIVMNFLEEDKNEREETYALEYISHQPQCVSTAL